MDALPPSQTALIQAFADHLRLERRLSNNTVDAYRRDLAMLASFLVRTRGSLEDATYLQLRRFLAQPDRSFSGGDGGTSADVSDALFAELLGLYRLDGTHS